MPNKRAFTYLAVLLALAAGTIHLYVMPEHWKDYWAYGAFFLALGLGQIAGAGLLVMVRSVALYWTGIVATLLLIGFYLFTRLVEVPIGPMAGKPEAVGMLDVASKVVEVLLVVSLLALVRMRRAPLLEAAQPS